MVLKQSDIPARTKADAQKEVVRHQHRLEALITHLSASRGETVVESPDADVNSLKAAVDEIIAALVDAGILVDEEEEV